MGSVCEIGGDLTKLTPDARRQLQTATTFFKPAKRTWTHIADPGIHRLPASHLTLERADGNYEAHLNWMSCNLKMDFPKAVRYLWTGRLLRGRYTIPPHGAVMYKSAR